jgi:hypothetical protein
MGSIAIGAAIAKLVFVVVIALGFLYDELSRRTLAVFAIAGLVVWFGLPLVPGGALFVLPALAIVDIALVLAVFKGDVRVT